MSVARLVISGVVLLLIAFVAIADSAGRTGHGVLDAFAPLLGGGIDWAPLGSFFIGLRVPLLVALLTHLGFRCVRAGGLPDRPLLGTALGIAWVAQSFVMAGPQWLGMLLYGLAVGLWWVAPRGDAPGETAIPASVEAPVALLIFAAMLVACLIHLDVTPPLHVDEMAYAYVSRLRLGEVASDAEAAFPVFGIYDYGHFRAQALAFGVQSAGVSVLGPGVLALRLVSVIAAVLALALVYTTLRRTQGPWFALGFLSLAAFAPLLLTSARYGHMISISILHGAVTLALLLYWLERPGRAAAAGLGLAIGASVYAYQVSWFVPVLAGLALLASGRVSFRGERALQLAVVAGVALLTLAPAALWLRADFETLIGRTLGDRGVWSDVAIGKMGRTEETGEKGKTGEGGAELGLVLATDERLDRVRMAELVSSLRGEGLVALPMVTSRGITAVAVTGDAGSVDSAMVSLELDSRNVVLSGSKRTWVSNVFGMLAELFAKPHIEFGLRLADVPILNPVVAPLIVLGLFEALRRRREPVLRVLVVWVVAGALLPAALASVAPRRAVLMLPFVHALAALPLVAWVRAGPIGRSGRAWLVGACFLCVAALGFGTGTDLTFERRGGDLGIWTEADPARDTPEAESGPRGSLLELVKRLKSLPPNETVRVAPIHPNLEAYLTVLEESGPPGLPLRVKVDPRAEGIGKIRRVSCKGGLPLNWVARSTLRTPQARRALDEAFVWRETVEGSYWLVHIDETLGNTCKQLSARRG